MPLTDGDKITQLRSGSFYCLHIFAILFRSPPRRLERGRLSLDESEPLLGLVKILALAKQTLGSKAKAVHWLKSPVPALGGATPLEYAETQIGLRELEETLVRIQDAVYS